MVFGCKGGNSKQYYTCRIHAARCPYIGWTYGIKMAKQSGCTCFLFLHLYLSFLFPLISQCASWRQDLWGTVYDIRLCISDSMMLIICLPATKKRREESESKRYMGSRTERRWTGNEQDGKGRAERKRGDMKI